MLLGYEDHRVQLEDPNVNVLYEEQNDVKNSRKGESLYTQNNEQR